MGMLDFTVTHINLLALCKRSASIHNVFQLYCIFLKVSHKEKYKDLKIKEKGEIKVNI